MARWLGLAVEEEGVKGHTPSSIRQPEELSSIEEALKILAGALQAHARSPRNSQPELSV
jgi:hypothetical protein